jgi:hypothetical protein
MGLPGPPVMVQKREASRMENEFPGGIFSTNASSCSSDDFLRRFVFAMAHPFGWSACLSAER